MTFHFKLPDIGEGTAEAEIGQWHVAVGDFVKEDQLLVDVMTDKATVEMTSPVTGTVVAIHGAVGEMLSIGSVLVEIRLEGEETGDDQAHCEDPAVKQPASAIEPPYLIDVKCRILAALTAPGTIGPISRELGPICRELGQISRELGPIWRELGPISRAEIGPAAAAGLRLHPLVRLQLWGRGA